MIFLSDNDILFKLAYCDLLDEFLAYLNSPVESVTILSTCIYKMRGSLKTEPIVLERLEKFCDQVSVIADDQIDSTILDEITMTGADAGEAILAAKVVTTPDAILVTGDKRAIKAFSQLSDGTVKNSLSGRILCFEDLILGMIETYGFSVLSSKLMAGCTCDGVLRNAFGPGRSEEHALDCLRSYADELRTTCPALLTTRFMNAVV
jgi:hypothetical protein